MPADTLFSALESATALREWTNLPFFECLEFRSSSFRGRVEKVRALLDEIRGVHPRSLDYALAFLTMSPEERRSFYRALVETRPAPGLKPEDTKVLELSNKFDELMPLIFPLEQGAASSTTTVTYRRLLGAIHDL